MDGTENKLSLKNYGLARLFSYLTLVCMIVMLFIPIIRIETVSEDDGIKAVVSISPYQFIMGATDKKADIVFLDEEDESTFMEELIRESLGTVEVIGALCPVLKDSFKEEEYIQVFRIVTLVLSVLIAWITVGAISVTRGQLNQPPANEGALRLNNSIYITQTYCSLPKILEFLKTFLSMLILIPIYALGGFNIFSLIAEGESEWNMNLGLTIASIVILFVLENAIISKIVFAKDCMKIKSSSARYAAPLIPTFSSDIKAIQGVFSPTAPSFDAPSSVTVTVDDTAPSVSVPSGDQEDHLYKYKKLLDDGLITQEDYEKKKNEILNL